MDDNIIGASMRAGLLMRIINWLSLGYLRETCIRFVVAEGYSESYAVDVVDQAISMSNES